MNAMYAETTGDVTLRESEAEFRALCAACDGLLMAPEAGLERIAVPWLHVIRPHPTFSACYEDVFTPHHKPDLHLFRSAASAIKSLAKALVADGRYWSGDAPLKSDVLLVSHLVNEAFVGQEDDFYYGGVAAELVDWGIPVTLALINYTSASTPDLAAAWRQAKVPRVVLSSVPGFLGELDLYRRALGATRHLYTAARGAMSDFERRVAWRAAGEALRGGTPAALYRGEQIGALVAHLRPRAIVVTYEGHSWERVAFAAARSVSSNITCVAYQHAALFNLQHAVRRRLGAAFDPDVILTSGEVGKHLLEQVPDLTGIPIAVMGSNRSFVRKPGRSWCLAPGEKRTCIVLPEGLAGECRLLFGLSLACARVMPEIEFRWRLHPNMSYDMLMRQNPEFRDLPANIVLSMQSLEEDVARSHWALYRGSSAIVQAAVSGVRPIYLRVPGEISIDTLHGIQDLHAEVVSVEDLRKLIATAEADEGGATETTSKVQDYCERMFTPFDSHALAKYVIGECDNK